MTNEPSPDPAQEPSTPIWRILDANANRAAEGLRVIEDYLRFALDDGLLSGGVKNLRHDLAEAISTLPSRELHAARESQQDVGASLATPSEYRRESLPAIAAANFKRAEQSFRALEEYAKPVSVELARKMESLRYRLYTLEKAVSSLEQAGERLADCRLYVLLDGRVDSRAFEQMANQLIAGGAAILQLRDKRLSDRVLLERALQLRALTRAAGVLFIMNDRPDLAVLSQADGVHLGQDELTVKQARTIVGPQRLIGVSTHSLEQARTAVLEGADYIGVGPTFPSTTKQFASFPGVDLLRQVAAEIRLPAYAIGGITLDNLDQVQAAGFPRVAVSGAILQASSPQTAAAQWRSRLAAND
ncbi:thiamine phosphate synthase [Lignipirellula cremea]|uniref:Thiamine-phosphate synthase n=1 Tax=Lignipirellula cremea TaxID=2528010 RepID=A0A518DR08_9BACT|nr:thiamine phosphate synthase [Lignipirellula cremea]QDU94278.1 Thiamine-phosphate synthase [Lignipirellula cremea]